MRLAKFKPDRLIAAALMTAAFALFDSRFLLHPFSSVNGFPQGDYGSALWNFWATRENLTALQNPFYTTVLFGGNPSSLFYHTLNLLYFIISAPLYLPTGNVFLAFNASQLAADGLSLFCFYRLAREVGAKRGLAVLGSMAFTFCAYRLQHWATLNLQSTWLISLYVWMLLRVWKHQRPRDGAILGLSIVGMLLADWHSLIFSALATPFLLLWFLREFARSKRMAGAAVAALIVLPVLSLYIAMAIHHASLSEYAPYNDTLRIYWSASPLYYVTPGWLEWIWTDLVGPYTREKNLSYKTRHEWALFLGIIPIILFLLYCIRFPKDSQSLPQGRFRGSIPLLIGIFAFFLISLGPCLILLHPISGPDDRLIQLPGIWFFNLPVFSALKHVSRFGIMVLFLMLLLAMTRRRLPLLSNYLGPKQILIIVMLILIHRLDMQPFLPSMKIYHPPDSLLNILRHHKISQGFAAVLPASAPKEEGAGLYLQTLHELPQLYGYLSRQPLGAFARADVNPFYQAMAVVQENPRTPLSEIPAIPENKRPTLIFLIPSSLLDDQNKAMSKALTEKHNYRLTYEDQDVIVFMK